MIQLRGIIIDYPAEGKRVRLTTRNEKGDDYETITYPPDQPLTHAHILLFLEDHYNIKPDDIVWAPHVKIPGEE